jgi:hypothetical protein
MAFEPLEVQTKHNRPVTASISYMRPTRKGEHKKGVKPQLIIALPTSIASMSKKKLFQLMIGKGQDAMKARIIGQNAKNNYTVEPRNLKFSIIYNFGFAPMLGDDIAGQERIAVRKISDDEFEIDLPPWFKANGA